MPLIARMSTGAVCGAAIVAPGGGSTVGGISAGVIGAVIGAFSGYEFRVRLVKAGGRDFPLAILEDALAAAGAVLIILARF